MKWTKETLMKHWRGLPDGDGDEPLDVMQAIPYKAKGSTFGADGVRICGSPEFIDSVLGKLKGLLEGEAVHTRLGLSRATAGSDFKAAPNAVDGGEVCYIQLFRRGGEGAMMQAFIQGIHSRAV